MSKTFTLILDSSQISLFLECPLKWYYTYVKRMAPSGLPEKADEAMNAGTYGHKLLDIYYRNKLRGLSLNDNIASCFTYDPDKDTCECGCNIDCHKGLVVQSVDRNDMEVLNDCQRCNRCLKFRPKSFALSQDVRFTVRNRFRDYVAKYQSEDLTPISEKHVEVGFSEPIYEDSENLFILEGRIDLLATIQGLRTVVDHKFQMRKHWLYPKSIQFKNYCLVAKSPMFMINYVRLTKEVNTDTLTRRIITFNQFELAAWKSRLINVFKLVKQSIEMDCFPQNWQACFGHTLTYSENEPRYCWYAPLCEEINEKVRAAKVSQLYKIKEEIWRPW